MNVKPGGKQRKMHPTIIPLDNPPPLLNEPDTHGQVQLMVYPENDPTISPELWGKPKGMRAVLQECHSVWRRLMAETPNGKPIGTCDQCRKSQIAKDTDAHVAAAEALGEDVDDILPNALEEPISTLDWCCMTHVLSLQSDFRSEKPLLQHYVEKRGHCCLFLPKFHCELNPIEMLWGYAKYRKLRHAFISHFQTLRLYQDIELLLMGNSKQQKLWFHNVWIPVILSQSAISSRKLGATWMHMSELSLSFDHLLQLKLLYQIEKD